MKKVSKSYLALKHDVVTMGLPFPFLQDFSVVYKTRGVGTIVWVEYDNKDVAVSFEN
mgnify:CR=1 FL=1|jgi:hypothetical protein